MEHPHKLCCLRQELVDAFAESRYMSFIKLAAYHLQTMGLNKKLILESSAANNATEETVSNEKVDEAITITQSQIGIVEVKLEEEVKSKQEPIKEENADKQAADTLPSLDKSAEGK